MVRLLCTKCKSDSVCFLETKNREEWFYCEDCGTVFGLFEADWEEG